MRLTKENLGGIQLEDKDKRLLIGNLSDINELNCMTGKDFYLDWQDFHDEYSPERTDPCPDYYGYFSIRENSHYSTIGEMYPTVKELDNAIIVLVDSFSTMGYNYYYSIGKGWYRLMREVILAIDKYNFEHPDDGQIHITYVKEKWGGLRIEIDSWAPEISDLILDIEERSHSICEECGKEGSTCEVRGYVYTLCDECRKKLTGGEDG